MNRMTEEGIKDERVNEGTGERNEGKEAGRNWGMRTEMGERSK